MAGDILTAFSALAFVVALLLIFMWGIKRFGLFPGQPLRRARSEKQIKILESVALDARNRLIAVRWQGQEYLIGSGVGGVKLIASNRVADPQDFAHLLAEENNLGEKDDPRA